MGLNQPDDVKIKGMTVKELLLLNEADITLENLTNDLPEKISKIRQLVTPENYSYYLGELMAICHSIKMKIETQKDIKQRMLVGMFVCSSFLEDFEETDRTDDFSRYDGYMYCQALEKLLRKTQSIVSNLEDTYPSSSTK